MSFGKMSTFVDIISTNSVKDSEGFTEKGDVILASVRAYKEDRHGSEKWANRAAFSQASALFRFRKIPNLEVTTDLVLVCSDGRYNIISVEDVKGRGMYIEVLAEKGEIKQSIRGGGCNVAKVEVKMPEEFLLKLSRLGERTDEIIPKVLEAGGEVVLSKVKSNLQSVIGSGTKYPSRATGELVNALGLSPAKQDRNGNHNIKIGFTEPRKDGESNAKIANIIEYGKSGQPPRPFFETGKISYKEVLHRSNEVKTGTGAGSYMSILSELNSLLDGLGIPIETGVFSGVPPDEYLVITPMTDTFEVFADNQPQAETQEVRLSLFIKGNYTTRKNEIVNTLLQAGFTITDRRYIGHEDDTGYHHYAIDVAKEYEVREE